MNVKLTLGLIMMVLGAAIIAGPIVLQQSTQQQQQQSADDGSIDNAKGLMDACIQSGYSADFCFNIFFSDNPGGMCTTLHIVDLACPKIQDPLKTYNDPEGAIAESEAKKRQIDSLIDQYDLLFPPGKGIN